MRLLNFYPLQSLISILKKFVPFLFKLSFSKITNASLRDNEANKYMDNFRVKSASSLSENFVLNIHVYTLHTAAISSQVVIPLITLSAASLIKQTIPCSIAIFVNHQMKVFP